MTADAVYLSPVKGHLVPRFSTLTSPGGRTNIGVSRSAKGELVCDEDAIVRIPVAEYGRYRKEYMRAIAGGALKERTREEFEARRVLIDKANAEAKAKRGAKPEAEAKAEATRNAEAEAEADTKPPKARKSKPRSKKSKAGAPPVAPSVIEPVEGAEPEPNGADE